MSTPVQPAVPPWYEDPHKLQEKRLALGVPVPRLAKIMGSHGSYIERGGESGRVSSVERQQLQNIPPDP